MKIVRFLKSLYEACCIALSMYSTIPVKILDWNADNLRHAMAFFPVVGICCGAGVGLVWYLCRLLDVGALLFAALAVLTMMLITGGIHADGFCDTADALYSRRSQEEKLKILKDVHCGAFSVLGLFLVLLLQTACYAELFHKQDVLYSTGILTGGFMLSRCLSSISVMTFSCAPTSTLAKTFRQYSTSGTKKIVILEAVVISFLMLYYYHRTGLFLICLAMLVFLYYAIMQKKQFGGMTGDLAGFFLTLCETVWLLGLALTGGILS